MAQERKRVSMITARRLSSLIHGGIEAGSWKLEAGSWKLEAGSWKLEAGSWKLEAGSWKLEAGSWKLEAGSWKLEAGSWKLEAGSWKLGRAWGIDGYRQRLGLFISAFRIPHSARSPGFSPGKRRIKAWGTSKLSLTTM
ncbi:hypothetical protein PSGK_19675 [Pseudomonas solani]|uniref:hypothetical protein n=1 Tax=Pseudomonas solani TaxID=2731552 RepID=UPI0035BE7B4B